MIKNSTPPPGAASIAAYFACVKVGDPPTRNEEDSTPWGWIFLGAVIVFGGIPLLIKLIKKQK